MFNLPQDLRICEILSAPNITIFSKKISSLNQPAFYKVAVLKISGFSTRKDLLRTCTYRCMASIGA